MRIRWTKPAAEDFTNICDYVKDRDGSEAALRVALRIYDSVSSLTQFPHRGRPGRKVGTRELIFSGLPFLAVYRVREDTVEITRLLHGAQHWP